MHVLRGFAILITLSVVCWTLKIGDYVIIIRFALISNDHALCVLYLYTTPFHRSWIMLYLYTTPFHRSWIMLFLSITPRSTDLVQHCWFILQLFMRHMMAVSLLWSLTFLVKIQSATRTMCQLRSRCVVDEQHSYTCTWFVITVFLNFILTSKAGLYGALVQVTSLSMEGWSVWGVGSSDLSVYGRLVCMGCWFKWPLCLWKAVYNHSMLYVSQLLHWTKIQCSQLIDVCSSQSLSTMLGTVRPLYITNT